MKKLLLILGIILLTIPTFASTSEIALQGKGSISCYYSSLSAFFDLTYINQNITFGSKVYVKFGFGGKTWKYENGVSYQDPFDWGFQNEQEMSAVAPYTWHSNFEQMINYRSGNYFLNSLQFVIRIHQPDGSEVYDRGNFTNFGYFNANFDFPALCPNGGNSSDYPLKKLDVTTVERNF